MNSKLGTLNPKLETSLRRHRFVFEFLSLFMSNQGLNDLIQGSFHYEVKLVNREADAMIADAILLEVVGANFFRPVTGADHRSTLTRQRFVLFLFFEFLQTR